MTKFDYSKAPEPDPARVIEVRESGVWSGNDVRPFETETQRKERYAKERKATAARSERIRLNAIIKKYGIERATDFGGPRAFVEAHLAARAKAQRNQERAQRKRERQVARHSGEATA